MGAIRPTPGTPASSTSDRCGTYASTPLGSRFATRPPRDAMADSTAARSAAAMVTVTGISGPAATAACGKPPARTIPAGWTARASDASPSCRTRARPTGARTGTSCSASSADVALPVDVVARPPGTRPVVASSVVARAADGAPRGTAPPGAGAAWTPVGTSETARRTAAEPARKRARTATVMPRAGCAATPGAGPRCRIPAPSTPGPGRRGRGLAAAVAPCVSSPSA